MNRAAGEAPTLPKGKRAALHHMITAGNLGYGAWRDGGFTILDISDPAKPKLLAHLNWSPPFPGGTHTPLPLPGRKLAVVAGEADRPASEHRARREDRGLVRHRRRPDVRQRLERGHARARIQGLMDRIAL